MLAVSKRMGFLDEKVDDIAKGRIFNNTSRVASVGDKLGIFAVELFHQWR